MNPSPLILIDTGIIGGPGRGLIQLASRLHARRLEYLVCSFKYREPKSLEFQDALRELGLRSRTVSQNSLYDPTPLYEFTSLAHKGGFNIIQSHGYKSHFVALTTSRLLGIPWVAFTHGWTSEDRKVMAYHALDKLMLRFAECVITVSPPLYETFTKIRGKKRDTRLILNAVDTSLISGAAGGAVIRAQYCHSRDTVLVGCFGRLSFEKGQDLLLEALALLSDTLPNVSLLLLGDGPMAESLSILSARLGLSEKVFLKPHTSTIRDYYEAIDLLVLPSRSEGLPNVVLEALALGVPVVATDVGAVREVISDAETGWIVEADNSAALAQGIQDALSNEREKGEIIKAGKHLIAERFSPSKRCEQIISTYEDTLARHYRRA